MFVKDLIIDEEKVPHLGRHPYIIFITGKSDSVYFKAEEVNTAVVA